MKWLVIENIVIYVVIGATILGGVLLTGTWMGLWSLVLILVVNT